MSADWDDKPLGYKHPPVWTQFQKGQSGNPRGRPRKQKPAATPDAIGPSALDDALRKERERKVRVNDVDGPKDLQMYEVVLRSLMNNAAKGDVRAQREALKLWRELELRDAQRAKDEEARRKRLFDYVCSLKDSQAKKWAMAEKAGAEPADPWPHPDDIFINAETGRWHIRGPFDEAFVPYFSYCRAERDALFGRLALEIYQCKSDAIRKRFIGELWVFWETQLPKRWQIIDRCEANLATFMMWPLRRLRAHVDACTRRASELRPASFRTMDKETYRTVNGAMKPLLQRGGYRSLAEFEKTYDQYGKATPWPKRS